MKRQMIYSFTALAGVCLLNSCVPLAAGAAGGYLLHQNGYRVQNPVKKADVKVQSPLTKQPQAVAEPYEQAYPPQGY